MDLERLLKSADVNDEDSLRKLSRELEKRGYGKVSIDLSRRTVYRFLKENEHAQRFEWLYKEVSSKLVNPSTKTIHTSIHPVGQNLSKVRYINTGCGGLGFSDFAETLSPTELTEEDFLSRKLCKRCLRSATSSYRHIMKTLLDEGCDSIK